MMMANTQPIRLFIDGACPMCRREGAMIRRLDKGRGLVALVDIADPEFDAGQFGRTREAFMGAIHAAMPDGRIVTGLEAFRRVYRALSPAWGALWAPTGWPVLRVLFDALYRVFARHRVRIGSLFGGHREACASGTCRVG
ncbi:MAG: DUF393 domain-containing protein [Planctomycetes bacterium]|nr:DUF393 domain-containing protein [Planctomycetota bacterium]